MRPLGLVALAVRRNGVLLGSVRLPAGSVSTGVLRPVLALVPQLMVPRNVIISS